MRKVSLPHTHMPQRNAGLQSEGGFRWDPPSAHTYTGRIGADTHVLVGLTERRFRYRFNWYPMIEMAVVTAKFAAAAGPCCDVS